MTSVDLSFFYHKLLHSSPSQLFSLFCRPVRKQAQEASGFELLQLQHQIAPLDRIKERLSQLLAIGDAADDTIPPEELEESEAAWQEYKDGDDPRLSLEELKLKLFGKKA